MELLRHEIEMSMKATKILHWSNIFFWKWNHDKNSRLFPTTKIFPTRTKIQQNFI